MSLYSDVDDNDVYEYRRTKEVKLHDYYKQVRAEDTSLKRSVRTSVGYVDFYIYFPRRRTTDAVFFDFHGGGFVLSHWEQDAPYCRQLADASGAVVINVDYLVAPEYKFPLPITTTYEVLRWCDDHAEELGISRGNFVVGGSSAGAGVAAGLVYLGNHDTEKGIAFSGLVMNYPACKQRTDARPCADPDKVVKPERLHQYISWTFESLDDLSSPLASPLEADVKGYPPVMINTASFDSFCAEAEEFRDKLETAGVSVDYKCYQGCEHGFTHKELKEFNPDASADCWARIARFIAAAQPVA